MTEPSALRSTSQADRPVPGHDAETVSLPELPLHSRLFEHGMTHRVGVDQGSPSPAQKGRHASCRRRFHRSGRLRESSRVSSPGVEMVPESRQDTTTKDDSWRLPTGYDHRKGNALDLTGGTRGSMDSVREACPPGKRQTVVSATSSANFARPLAIRNPRREPRDEDHAQPGQSGGVLKVLDTAIFRPLQFLVDKSAGGKQRW